MRPVNAWESKVQRLVTETTLTARPDVMTWTVLQLMTDTLVLEQARDMIDLQEYQLAKAEQQALRQ